jgi:putative copper resistance protein D
MGSAMILVALPYFVLAILNPVLGSDQVGSYSLFNRTLTRWLWIALMLEALSGVVWFWVVTAQMSDQSPWTFLDGADLKAALGQTQFGQLWLCRSALGVALAGTLFFVSRKTSPFSPKNPASIWLLLAISGSLLVTLAWAGHGASGIHHHALHLGADILHLLIGSVWPIGLIPLGLFLRHTRAPAQVSPENSAVKVLLRFSQASVIAVLLITATGLINGWLMIGNWTALVTTTYGVLLSVKVLAVVLMVALGAYNRLYLLPRTQEGAPIFRSLRRTILLESCLALVVLLIVGMMGMTPPPSQ